VIKTGFESNISAASALVTMYAKCSSIEYAHKVFKRETKHDLILWSAMLIGYAQANFGEEALDLFCEMQRAGMKSDQFIFASILQACASLETLGYGKEIHTHIIKTRYGLDVSMGNCLLNMYSRCGSTDDVRKLFCLMTKQDMGSWSAVISGYAHNNCGEKALSHFCEMQRAGMTANQPIIVTVLKACCDLVDVKLGMQLHTHIIKVIIEPDICLASALVTMYDQCGMIEDAFQVFHNILEKDVVLWTTMIAGYAKNEHYDEALELFCKMKRARIKPDQFTFASVLSSCASLGDLEHGKGIHACILKRKFESDLSIGNTLVTLYAKCRRIEDAHKVFEKMPKQDIISWIALISGYAQSGHGKESFKEYVGYVLVL
jgi:pentatricopeptide repeat protein